MGDDTLRVLVLDRDLGSRTMCAQIVAMLGHDVAEVGESEVALDLLCAQPHRLLIVDWDTLEQPRWTQLGRLLSARPGCTPACVLTCAAGDEAELGASAAGPVLVKPVAPNLLMQAVSAAIDGPAPAPEAAPLEPEPALDAPPALDSSPPLESAPVDDDAPLFDDGPFIDSGPITDSGPPIESAPIDDDAPLFDDGPALDFGPITDSGPPAESAPIDDDAPLFDDGPIIDSGPPVDAGPLVDDASALDDGPILTDDGAIIADDAPSVVDLPKFGDDLPTGEMEPAIANEPVHATPATLDEPGPEEGPLFTSEPILKTSPMMAFEPTLEAPPYTTSLPDPAALEPPFGDEDPVDGAPGARTEGTAADAIALVEDEEEGWGDESTDVSRGEPSKPAVEAGPQAGGVEAEEAGLSGHDTSGGAQSTGTEPALVFDQGEAGEETWEAEERDPATATLEEGETGGQIAGDVEEHRAGEIAGDVEEHRAGEIVGDVEEHAAGTPPEASAIPGEDELLSHEFIITSGFSSERADDVSESSGEGRISSEYIKTAASVSPEDAPPSAAGEAARDSAAPPPPPARHRGPILRIHAAAPADIAKRPSSVPLEPPGPEPQPPDEPKAVAPPATPEPEQPIEEVRQIVPGLPSRGELAEYPFVKLIVTAMLHKLTGSLSVTRRGLCQEFHFENGKPVGISIDNPAGGLIPWLFGQDLINDADSDAALDEALETGGDQASIIFRRQLLDPNQLVSAMGDHFTALCTETIGFADGTFSFREGKPALKSPPLSGVSLPKIVVQGMLEYAQSGHIIQLLDLPVQAVPIPLKGAAIQAQDIPLPTLEARTRDLAVRSASMREIIDSSHLEPVKTQALIRALFVLGSIEIDPTGQSAPTRPASTAPRQSSARPAAPPSESPPSSRPSAPPSRPTPAAAAAPPAEGAPARTTPAPAPPRPSAPPPAAARPSRPSVIDYVHSDRQINVKAEMRQILKDYAEAERAQQTKPSGLLSRLLSDSPNREDWKASVKKMVKQQKDEEGGGKGLLGKLFKKGS